MGLALTRRIVEAQGGQVGVTSIFGKGSAFYAILPKTPRKIEIADEQSTVSISSAPTNAPSILVIEDDPKDRAILIDTLTKAGYAVETAVNGAEALRRASERQFDAMTLDLLLPDMSGWDILRSIRAKGINKEIPVIVVTVIAEKAASFGFMIHDFLTKPVAPKDLLSALHRAKVFPHATKTVLVIDDDSNALKLAKSALNNAGYRAVCVSDGATGLKTVEQEHPDLIVLDLLMPGMDGFEFLYCLRKTKIGQRTPVVVWTVKDLTSEERASLQSAAQAVVLKGEGITSTLLVELQNFVPLVSHDKKQDKK